MVGELSFTDLNAAINFDGDLTRKINCIWFTKASWYLGSFLLFTKLKIIANRLPKVLLGDLLSTKDDEVQDVSVSPTIHPPRETGTPTQLRQPVWPASS